MDITLQRSDVEREFGLVRRMAERKATIPVLSFARVTAAGDAATIEATDLDSSLALSCAAVTADPGVALVPMRAMYEIAKSCAGDDIRLETVKGRVRVTCGAYVSLLATESTADFPTIPDVDGAPVSLPSSVLGPAITRVLFVTETEVRNSSRAYTNGAELKVSGGSMMLTATDAHRVARVVANGVDGEFSALVPRKALGDIAALLGDDDEEAIVSASVSEGRAKFVVGRRTLTAALISATMPAIDRIIPKTNGRSADIDRDAWRDTLRRVKVVSTELTRCVRLSFGDSQLEARMMSAKHGEATEGVRIETKGEPWVAGFNVDYLIEFLSACEPGLITISQKDEKAIAKLQSGSDYTYVIAPMDLAHVGV